MKAQAVRPVIVANADLAVVHTRIATLRNGGTLTAGQSGVAAEAAISDLNVVDGWTFWFDGIRWVAILLVTE